MGLGNIFKMGKVVAATNKAIKQQRLLGKNLAALPMPEFVAECIRNLNESAGNWEARARPPNPNAAALCKDKRLPLELTEFYTECDGFEAVHGEIPAALCALNSLRLGADFKPSLADQLAACWRENGNDSDEDGLLSVLPPDNLLALATHDADCYLEPSALNQALVLCEPQDDDFVVILLEDAGAHLPRGTVLEVECGSATRYPSFKAWLGSRASVFGSLAAQIRSG
jgi:hypothetical protein